MHAACGSGDKGKSQNPDGFYAEDVTYTLATGTTTVKLTPDNSGAVVADAVKAVLASQDGITASYIYSDQVDTPRMITRPSDNQMVWRWDQADPFGAAAPNQNPASLGTFIYNPRFPGQLFDSEDNLSYNGFRNYDPTLGRYVQSDSVGINGGLATYAYAAENPLGNVDRFGDSPEETCGALSNCTKIFEIVTEYSGPCFGSHAHLQSGYFQIWTCSPYIRTRAARCIFSATTGING